MGKIFLHFKTVGDAKQANSLLNYVLENPNIYIDGLDPLADLIPPVVYWLSTIGASPSTAYIDFNGATDSVPYDTSFGYTFSSTISIGEFGGGTNISKSSLIGLLVYDVVDTRDGVINISTQSIVLTGTAGTTVDSIAGEGTYSLTFNLSDIAGNNLSGVILNLTITA
jgi:hypothetical protein